jgi:hypothetical protein
MKVRQLKLRTMAAMQSTVVLVLRLPREIVEQMPTDRRQWPGILRDAARLAWSRRDVVETKEPHDDAHHQPDADRPA